MSIYHNGIKIGDLFHNGKHINKIFHNGKCIYAAIVVTVGQSLYDGIPSNGIMLYGNVSGGPSFNPLGIQGDSINLNTPLSSCPNGIKINFSNISYSDTGVNVYRRCYIPDISIPKGSYSGSSAVVSEYCTGNSNSSITASINGSALSFSVNNGYEEQTNKGTVTYMIPSTDDSQELLAITGCKLIPETTFKRAYNE